MEGGEPGVAHPVSQQALDALAVEAVHVGGHPVGRLRQPSQLSGEPAPPGVSGEPLTSSSRRPRP